MNTPSKVKAPSGGYFWCYRVPGRAPEHWDKLIEISFLGCTYAENEKHVRHLLRIMLNVTRLPNGAQVWPKTD